MWHVKLESSCVLQPGIATLRSNADARIYCAETGVPSPALWIRISDVSPVGSTCVAETASTRLHVLSSSQRPSTSATVRHKPRADG
eukprot:5408232-Alexandrium_andersonii.AAC.1